MMVSSKLSCGYERALPFSFALVAQLICTQRVVGSSPTGSTIYTGAYISRLDSHSDKVEVLGSTPRAPTTCALIAQQAAVNR